MPGIHLWYTPTTHPGRAKGVICMTLNGKDLIGTVLAAGAAYIGYVGAKGLAYPLFSSHRVAVFVLLVLGLGGCIFASSIGSTPDWKNPMMILGAVLGGLALLLILIGLIKPSGTIVAWIAADIVVLWLIATLRHAFAK